MIRPASEISEGELEERKKTVLLKSLIGFDCPTDPTIKSEQDLEENPKTILSSLFLLHSRKPIPKGYELSLRGERVFRQMGRRIDDWDLKTIFDYLKDEEIISLDLSNNLISSKGFEMLCQFLLNSKLINLNLRNNEIKSLTNSGCDKLRRAACLKRLTLSGNHLKHDASESIRIALKDNKVLEVLELAGVDFFVHSVNKLVNVLANQNNTLKVLNISRLLGIPKYRLRSYYLSHILKKLLIANHTLVELHLEKNGITDHDVERLMEALSKNQTMKVLNLSANFISNVGLENISSRLPQSSLQVLLLRSNTIGDQGAIALSKAMPLSSIIHLDIAFNRITELGLASLLWTIKKDIPLYTFYIFGNKITKQVLEIIHIQMLRGKIIPDSLDIILYWEEDGTIRCSYNPDADIYRKQLAGLYDGGFFAKKENILPYPVVNVFRSFSSLLRAVDYPKATDPKLLSHYKDHISIK